ncbi:MAG: phage major capsid protein [Pseudomonadota bacterium]
MNLRELVAERDALKVEGSGLLDVAERENRKLSAEEDARFVEIETQLADLSSKISDAQHMAERRANMQAVETHSITGQSLPGLPMSASEIHVRQDRSQLDPACGFQSIAEFASAVLRANPQTPNSQLDQRLAGMYAAPTNFHRETASDDGYLVPPEFRDQIWKLVFEQDGLINMIDAKPTSKNQVNDNVDESTPWGSSGVKAYWRSEGGQMTPTRKSVKPRSIILDELYAFVLATDELLEDAPRLNSLLTEDAARAINWTLDDAIIYGNGVGQPLGYFESPALVSVPKETGQTADTIVSENIANMYARLLPESQARCMWMANINVLPQLMHLKIGDNLIWTPPSEGFRSSPGGFLLGRPLKFTQHAKTLGDRGDLQLIDPKGYYGLRKTGGVKFATSIHLYFDYGQQAFRWTVRFGGQPHLSAPVSPNNGSETLSHFIVLDART